MRRCVAVVIAAGALCLAGCCTTPHGTKWEYKVTNAHRARSEGPQAQREAQQVLLNDLGKEGWELVSQTDGYVFYFKRPTR